MATKTVTFQTTGSTQTSTSAFTYDTDVFQLANLSNDSIRQSIPRFATITDIKISVQAQRGGDGNSTYDTDLQWWKKEPSSKVKIGDKLSSVIPSQEYRNFEITAPSWFYTSGSQAGEKKYSNYIVGITCSGSLLRNYYTQNKYGKFTFTYPTYAINLSIASIKNNKGETLDPGTVVSAGFTSGTAFDIDVASNSKTVSMTATPNTGFDFSHWTVGNENKGEANPLSLTLNDTSISDNSTNVTYVANFSRKNYTISAAMTGSGSIKFDGVVKTSQSCPYKDRITLEALPASGWYFEKWSDGITTQSRTISVTGNATYTAIFQQYRILSFQKTTDRGNINSTRWSYSQPVDGKGYKIGETITIEVLSIPSSHNFTGWYRNNETVPRENGDSTITYTFGSAVEETFTAKHMIKTYLIEPIKNQLDYGDINVTYTSPHSNNVNGNYYDYGTKITLTAIPKKAKAFFKWQYNNNYYYTNEIEFNAQDYKSCTCFFRKTYVTYDTLFCLPKWVESGITSNTINCSFASEDKILLTNLSTNGITKNCLIIPVNPNQVYRFDFDISLPSYKVLLRYCNSINENDVKTTEEKTINSFDFQPTTEFLSIAFQIIGAPNTAATVSNILLYPNEDKYVFMKDTLNPLYRSNDTQWAIPTPYRTGYRFLGWYNTQEGQGTEENKVFSPGANMNPNGIDFPTSEDWVLYSHWENANKARFRIARTNANVVIPSKS